MKIYLVGGAVRDKLLRLPVTERDWVVVKGTVDEMLKLGYRQVGKEFPVFLHPKTNEEYALARMERKVGPGYKGFTFDTSPTVTLEEDLLRRDLTINAMAELDGELIDPYHGQDDLEKKLLRHVSPAFSEDPVRVLRVARFLARYHHLGFKIAPETIALMRKMVDAGEVNALVSERVWKELERALGEKNPEKFFEALDVCHALPILFPEINMNSDGINALICAEKQPHTSTLIRFAALAHLLAKKAIDDLCDRYRLPNDYRKLAQLTARYHQIALQAKSATAEQLLELFSVFDLYRHTSRFNDFLVICQAIADVHPLQFDADWLKRAAEKTASTDIKGILNMKLSGDEIGLAIKKQRLECLSEWLSAQHNNNGPNSAKI